MATDPSEKAPPVPDTTARPPAAPPATPVDQQAQEEAGKVREESGGYD